MKKWIASALMLAILFSFSGCVFLFLLTCKSERTDDPRDYYSDDCYEKITPWMPESLEPYPVNGFFFGMDLYLDLCYEIFLDLTVTEEQLESILSEARENMPLSERDAYYAQGYREIVFEDHYEMISSDQEYVDSAANVGWADIEKVIYDPEALNVVFVCFHANDTGVYNLSDVAYFKRFDIRHEEYVLYVMQTDEETTD